MDSKLLWKPDQNRIRRARITDYQNYVHQHYQFEAQNYQQLHDWSVKENEAFWKSIWNYFGVIGSLGSARLTAEGNLFESRWFSDSKLNFAENLLGLSKVDRTSLVSSYNEFGLVENLTRAELVSAAAKLADFLKELGVKKGDRVAGYLPNTSHALIAMLATSSLGAVWSSCSPDFGVEAVLDRFQQIKPIVMIYGSHYVYGQKCFSLDEKAQNVAHQLVDLKGLIRFDYIEGKESNRPQSTISWSHIMERQETALVFEACDFNDPLYILYSSGTTGKPKCIAHGIGGTLLQHLKEHALHTDLGDTDTLFFYTTCGWMMWNWLVSGIALGTRIVLYDGSPFHPKKTHLFDLVDETQTTVLGAGAKYYASCEKFGLSPRQTHQLSSLKATLSTGSPLLSQNFEYLYQQVKTDQCVSSISGGTDIVSCFALGCPTLPVYSGEIQCKGLGMDIAFLDDDGQRSDGNGELACLSSFPSKPICFWNDTDRSRYRSAYFSTSENIWMHGDFGQEVDHEHASGIRIFGRSDSVLNPGGVRIGTAEIYRQVETFEAVFECVAVAQNWDDDERILLFVKLQENAQLDEELIKAIKLKLREKASPKHVPAKIIAVPEIPKTMSGKIVEKAIKQVIHGEAIQNTDAIANPEALDFFSSLEFE